jgi:hypothetical protein
MVLRWPIFESGRGRARIDETAALLDAAGERQRSRVLDVTVELERVRRSVAAGKAAVRVAAVVLENTRERLRHWIRRRSCSSSSRPLHRDGSDERSSPTISVSGRAPGERR